MTLFLQFSADWAQGYTVERSWSSSAKFIDNFLILLPVASFKENFWPSRELWDFMILMLRWSLKRFIISLIVSWVATPSRLHEVLHQHAILVKLNFEFESTSWSDPWGADERTKSWLWATGQGLCTKKPGLAAAGKMLIFIQDWFERLSFNFYFLVLSFWMQRLADS